MPDPRAVFEQPEQYWDFLTASNDTEFEGQFFDRNICLNQSQLEQLRRDKGVVDYEQADCCVYDVRDLDLQVLPEFRKVFLQDSGYDYSDEELLYQVGAINRNSDGYNFTNAGMLFFASNPQRVLSASFMRLLRFETDVENIEDRGLPTFDRKFTGSITKQVRDIRTFFRESGFFKLYQTRNPDGGFLEVPEYPLITVDEAIVNAVAHREYAIGLPIECESYRNAFVVRNSGRLQQRDQDVPAEFSLETMRLNSAPRNPKLIEWLKMMRDERGAEFVRALSEGTRRMRDEMKGSGLPAPIYKMSESQTTVILFNNVQKREDEWRSRSLAKRSVNDAAEGSLTVNQVEVVASLVDALKEGPQACIQVGSLLMVKTIGDDGQSVISSRTLTNVELRLLASNQSMLRYPDQILEWLNHNINNLLLDSIV